MARIPLPIHSYGVAHSSADGSRLVNAYAEQTPQPNAKGPVLVRRAPGIAAFAAPGAGPGRGLYVMRGVLYAVSGDGVYRLDATGSATRIGDLPGLTRVQKANNGAQALLLSPYGDGYVATDSSVTPISDPDFRLASAVDFIDNYMVLVEANSGRFYCSDLLDATSYDALDFATAEGAPDDLVTLIVSQRQVLLLGVDSFEVWWNSGAAGFPFERLGSGFGEIGCAAAQGVARQDSSAFWLASDRTVRVLRGATPQRVSTHGVERALRGYARVDDCQAFAFTMDGHLCVAFRFPSAGACWIYDATADEWHERESYARPVWRGVDAAQCYGKTFVQDALTGAVGILDPDTYAEWGDLLVDQRDFMPVYDNQRRLFHQSLEIVGDLGVGLIDGQGAVPTIRLQKSDDGGRTWAEVPSRTLGRIGAYKWRAKWSRLGMARDRKYRTVVSDAVPVTFTDVQLEIEAGDA